MKPIVMQDWVTIKGTANNSVIQDATKWLQTGPYQDMFFYIDVRELSNITTINIETAPSRDDVLFQAAVSAAVTIGTNFKTALLTVGGTTPPIGAWTRWKCVAPAAVWDLTFRILAVGNSLC